MTVERLPPALDGERLDRVVAFLVDVSRSVAAQLVASGAVRVDGIVATSGKLRVVTGAAYQVRLASLSTSVPAHGHEH